MSLFFWKNHSLVLFVLMIAFSTTIQAQESDVFVNDYDRPPTMGWSSWNTFGLNISESLIRSQANAMVRTGLDKAGYNYINIDDGFWNGRGDDGKLILNTKLFPHGMKNLTDYIHSKGLMAGIYLWRCTPEPRRQRSVHPHQPSHQP